MKFHRYLLIGFIALLLAGCGQTVKESLKAVPADQRSLLGQNKTIVVLPFADYSQALNLESAYRRQLFITENLVDQLVGHSFRLPIQEDVFRYLVEQNVINVRAYEDHSSPTVKNELNNAEWSSRMKEELSKYISQNGNTDVPVLENPGTHGLTSNEIVKIGKHFQADYILRGRIVQYKERQDPTWEPWKKGVLPFLFGSTSQITFGQAGTEQYDTWNNLAVGATYGHMYGSTKTDETIFGVSDGNAILWSGLGAAAANFAQNSGRIPQAVVQLRMWVQDAFSGDVVWTNRVDVKISPESLFADYQYDALFEGATEKAVSTLITNFVSEGM